MLTLPLYEYQCPTHGVFELMRKFSDPPLTACPTCGAPVEKLLSAPAIQFKGTGWYITDYARKSSPSGEKPAPSNGGGKDKPASTASDSKPAASSTSSGGADKK